MFEITYYRVLFYIEFPLSLLELTIIVFRLLNEKEGKIDIVSINLLFFSS